MKILLTGGAGFIGSHTLIELTEAGHEAVVVDNLDNSSPISLKRVAKIIGKPANVSFVFTIVLGIFSSLILILSLCFYF